MIKKGTARAEKVMDMTDFSLENIIKYAEKLTDNELEREYYDAVYDSLGSQCEDMYDLGYDTTDIIERKSMKNI